MQKFIYLLITYFLLITACGPTTRNIQNNLESNFLNIAKSEITAIPSSPFIGQWVMADFSYLLNITADENFHFWKTLDGSNYSGTVTAVTGGNISLTTTNASCNFLETCGIAGNSLNCNWHWINCGSAGGQETYLKVDNLPFLQVGQNFSFNPAILSGNFESSLGSTLNLTYLNGVLKGTTSSSSITYKVVLKATTSTGLIILKSNSNGTYLSKGSCSIILSNSIKFSCSFFDSNNVTTSEVFTQTSQIAINSTEPYVIAGISDTHICKVAQIDPKYINCAGQGEFGINGPGNLKDVVQKINQHAPYVRKTIIDGDLTNYGEDLAKYNSVHYNNANPENWLSQYLAAKTELDLLLEGYIPVSGNHDTGYSYFFSGNDFTLGFRTAFNLPADHYVIDAYYKNWQFVVLACKSDWGTFSPYNISCTSEEINMLHTALDNGKKTIVFTHHNLIKNPASISPLDIANAEAILSILRTHSNFVLLAVGHDGCKKGMYVTSDGVTQLTYSHKWLGNCGESTASNTINDPIPTITYFNLYNDKLVINEECTTTFAGCTNPPPHEIQVNPLALNTPPIGWLDSASTTTVSGWACDKDTPDQSIEVQLFFGGPLGCNNGVNCQVVTVTANATIGNYSANCGGTGAAHNFQYTIPQSIINFLGSGSHPIYAYGINSGPGANALLFGSPKSIIVPTAPLTPPIGWIDGATTTTISGWACDKDTPDQSIKVQLYFGGPLGCNNGVNCQVVTVTANATIGNYAANCGGTGAAHNFQYTIPASIINFLGAGSHPIYAYGINTGPGANALLFGSPKTITIRTLTNNNTRQDGTYSNNTGRSARTVSYEK